MPRAGLYGLLVVSGLMTLLGLAMVATEGPKSAFPAVFFALCTAVAVWQLWPNLLRGKTLEPGALLARYPGPVELRVGRGKMLGLLFASLCFVGISGWTLHAERVHELAALALWAGILFFGACTLAFLVLLFVGSSLRLEADGMAVSHLWRRRFSPWKDIDAFGVASVSGQRLVVYDDRAAAESRVASLNRGLVGRNSALPDVYGLASQDDLAWLLDAWRERALTERIGKLQPSA